MTDGRVACVKRSEWLVVGVGALNTIKWLLAALLLVIAAVSFQYYADLHIVIRFGGVLVAVACALGIAATTPQGKQTLVFLKSAKAEARKVVWPTRQETVQSTLAVVVMVLVASLFLWLVDSLLLYVMSWVTA